MNKIKHFVKKLRKFKKLVLLFIIIIYILVLFDIFFIGTSSDLRFFGLVIPYVLLTLFYKVKSKQTLLFCIFLLIILFTKYIISGPEVQTEEIAVWFVLFFTAGVLQQLRE